MHKPHGNLYQLVYFFWHVLENQGEIEKWRSYANWGQGTISINTKEGTKLIFSVLYVPCLDQDLLSMDKMLTKGYSLFFKDKMCIIYDPHGCDIEKVGTIDNSFPLDFNMDKQSDELGYSIEDNTIVWNH